MIALVDAQIPTVLLVTLASYAILNKPRDDELCMRLDLSLKLPQARRTWTPYFVLVFSLLLTALATYYVGKTAKAKERLRFENAVQRTKDDIQNRLETCIALLRASSGLFAASERVSRAEFRAFVSALELRQRYPGIQGIGFSIRVKPEEKDALVAEMHRQGVKNFTIRPASYRAEYYSIIYLEPLDRRNQAAIGFDMFNEPVRRRTMERARDTGAPAASGRVTLIQEIDKHKQAGFLIYVPVYRNGRTPQTVQERQAALRGFVYSPFRADDLLKGIFGTQKQPEVDFQIYDGTDLSQSNLLHRFRYITSGGLKGQPRFTTIKTINIAGRTWSIAFASRPEFDLVSQRSLVPYIWLGGVLISFVLFGVTRFADAIASLTQALAHQQVQRLNVDLERQVQERTAQLQQAFDFEAMLKRIADKVRDSLDEHQILQTAVQELALGLNVDCCNTALYDIDNATSTIRYEYPPATPASEGRMVQIAFPLGYRQLSTLR